jgi:hypothetical protein
LLGSFLVSETVTPALVTDVGDAPSVNPDQSMMPELAQDAAAAADTVRISGVIQTAPTPAEATSAAERNRRRSVPPDSSEAELGVGMASEHSGRSAHSWGSTLTGLEGLPRAKSWRGWTDENVGTSVDHDRLSSANRSSSGCRWP